MAAFGKRSSGDPSPPVQLTVVPVAAGTGTAQTRGTAAASTDVIRDQVLFRIEPTVAVRMTQADLSERVGVLVSEIATELKLLLNRQEQQTLAHEIVDDMVGLGPLEPLLRDDTISDILVNGPRQIYVERRGKLVLTGLHFRNNLHVLHVAQRIASAVGRRVDESSPMLDARLADGSRVNVVIPPLVPKSPVLTIRKFSPDSKMDIWICPRVAVGFNESNLHSFNRYGYGNNNPYRYTDPDGKSAVLLLLDAVFIGTALIVASDPKLAIQIGKKLWGAFHNLFPPGCPVAAQASDSGVGRLLYEGITFRDFPVVQAVVLLGGGMIVVVNLLIDVLYAVIDPRIRLEA
jgi:hypothetical protein